MRQFQQSSFDFNFFAISFVFLFRALEKIFVGGSCLKKVKFLTCAPFPVLSAQVPVCWYICCFKSNALVQVAGCRICVIVVVNRSIFFRCRAKSCAWFLAALSAGPVWLDCSLTVNQHNMFSRSSFVVNRNYLST